MIVSSAPLESDSQPNNLIYPALELDPQVVGITCENLGDETKVKWNEIIVPSAPLVSDSQPNNLMYPALELDPQKHPPLNLHLQPKILKYPALESDQLDPPNYSSLEPNVHPKISMYPVLESGPQKHSIKAQKHCEAIGFVIKEIKKGFEIIHVKENCFAALNGCKPGNQFRSIPLDVKEIDIALWLRSAVLLLK